MPDFTFQNCPRSPLGDIFDFLIFRGISNPPSPAQLQPSSSPAPAQPARLLLKAKLKARQPRAKLVVQSFFFNSVLGRFDIFGGFRDPRTKGIGQDVLFFEKLMCAAGGNFLESRKYPNFYTPNYWVWGA